MVNQGKILIVEYEAGSRESLRNILGSLYDVHTAENGQETLRYIHEQDFDIVILGLKMPGLSSIEVLKEVKKAKPDVVVIVITGYGMMSIHLEASRNGVADFITTPFNAADIICEVNNAPERQRYQLKIKKIIKDIRNLQREKEVKERDELLYPTTMLNEKQ